VGWNAAWAALQPLLDLAHLQLAVCSHLQANVTLERTAIRAALPSPHETGAYHPEACVVGSLRSLRLHASSPVEETPSQEPVTLAPASTIKCDLEGR
jgi:hypothetical protein